MKKILAVILALILICSCCAAAAEEAGDKYEQLTVGVTTAFNGNFLSDALGSNISDQDVRKLIHSYRLAEWDSATGAYLLNDQVITSVLKNGEENTYAFTIARNLTYSDGTPITARDYAFAFLLMTSKQILEASGLREDGSRVLGWQAYDEGLAAAVSGFRLHGDYEISITISGDYTPYFYEMKSLDLFPLPIDEILPGCEVRDDGKGIYIDGAFGAETIRQTVLDADTGYASHPSVTSGPYVITNYDGKTVWLSQNPYYIGDKDGNLPYITELIVRYIPSRDLMASLIVGDIDLAVRCARIDQIQTGQALARSENYALRSYSRPGLAFVSFCAEKGATADVNVRKAIAMCMDKETLTAEYMGNMGTTVTGYYGIGQWMFPMTRGMIPEAWTEAAGENADWSDMTLDGITEYTLDVEAAKQLLDAAGWNLNAEGGAYTEGVRYKMEDGAPVPLSLRLDYPSENTSAPILEEAFVPYLNEAGIEIELVAVNMPTLLRKYYAQDERDCDMILIGTNFQDVFDPSIYYDEYGKDRLNGITDTTLAELARDMRKTDPEDAPTFVRKWIRFLEYRSEILPEIPLYSNAYLDFFTVSLQNYYPAIYSSWSEALIYAYLGDYVEEELEEEEYELEEGEELFD